MLQNLKHALVFQFLSFAKNLNISPEALSYLRWVGLTTNLTELLGYVCCDDFASPSSSYSDYMCLFYNTYYG